VERRSAGRPWPRIAEDLAAARVSFHLLAGLEFELAVFGHGRPILSGAAARFRDVETG
jgi:hypothetical protein